MSEQYSQNYKRFSQATGNGGLDALQGSSPELLQVGAQRCRIPVILLLDIPASQTEAFEPYIDQLLEWLYSIEFKDDSDIHETSLRCRISLSIMSTARHGVVILPPRLLSKYKEGFPYFFCRSDIEKDALKHILFPLYNKDSMEIMAIKTIDETYDAYFNDKGLVPAAYAIGNGDAPFITILMTGGFDISLFKNRWGSLIRKSYFTDNCHSLCIWDPTSNEEKGIAEFESNVAALNAKTFLASGGMNDGLADKMIEWMTILSKDIKKTYLQREILRPNYTNVFPDVVLPCLKGNIPAITLGRQKDNAALIPLSPLVSRDKKIYYLESKLVLQIPEDEKIENGNISFVFQAPRNVFGTEVQCHATACEGSSSKYELTIKCRPQKSWDDIYAGLNFRGSLTFATSSAKTYEVTIFGLVWRPILKSTDGYVFIVPEIIVPPSPKTKEGTSSDSDKGKRKFSISVIMSWIISLFLIVLVAVLLFQKNDAVAPSSDITPNFNDNPHQYEISNEQTSIGSIEIAEKEKENPDKENSEYEKPIADEVQELKQELKGAKAQLKMARNELETIKAKNNKKVQDNMELSKKCQQLEQQLGQLEQQLGQLRAENGKYEKDLKTLNDKLEESEAKLKKYDQINKINSEIKIISSFSHDISEHEFAKNCANAMERLPEIKDQIKKIYEMVAKAKGDDFYLEFKKSLNSL